jgi:hypothetical protein
VTLPRITLDELIDALADRVAERVAARLAAPPATASELVAVRACGLPLRTVRGAIRRSELTAVRLGRADYLRRADLEAWLGSRPKARRDPQPEPEAREPSVDERIDALLDVGRLRALPGGR